MTSVTQVAEGIWCFPIPLPNNPLRWLNCYVVKGHEGGRNLLIDTGFDRDECHQALNEGMSQLSISPENTDVFITHFHTDHSGNAAMLQRKGARLIMGRVDHDCFLQSENGGWQKGRDVFCAEGLPLYVYEAMQKQDRSVMFSSGIFEADRLVDDGEILSYGNYELECVMTPGHTPGQICLYDRKSEIMFTADHVLFDITPNIGPGHDRDNNLGTYMNSLRRLREYPIRLALPGHRTSGGISVYDRIDSLIAHHERRIAETEKIIRDFPGSTGYDIASHMQWSINARNWEEFPTTQKWFALSETLAHVDYLLSKGSVSKSGGQEDFIRYYHTGK